ncbi:hypothetical protein CVT24_011979, partial [Panaeolus cyanescens]
GIKTQTAHHTEFPSAEPDEHDSYLRKPVVLPESSNTLRLLLQFVHPTSSKFPELSLLPAYELLELYCASKKYGIAAALEAASGAMFSNPAKSLGELLRQRTEFSTDGMLDIYAHSCITLPLRSVISAIPAEYHPAYRQYYNKWKSFWKASLKATRKIHPVRTMCPLARPLESYAYDMLSVELPLTGQWSKTMPLPHNDARPDFAHPLCCQAGYLTWILNGEKRALELPTFSQIMSMKAGHRSGSKKSKAGDVTSSST